MPVLRIAAIVIGILMFAMGVLWIGQGTGLIMWPAESFMLAERKWAVNGIILALAGGAVILLGRRIGRNSD